MKKSFTLLLLLTLAGAQVKSDPHSPSSFEQIASNLYEVEPSAATILLDGDLTQYAPTFSNALDGMDAVKMSNFTANIGMARGTTVLSIERRQTIGLTDTIFYKLWQLHENPYQLEFITNNLDHPGLSGFLEDSYLHTSSPVDLNGTTRVSFSITSDPGSKDVYRFRIIFKSAVAGAQGTLPLTFTSVNAYRQNNGVNVNWKTTNEANLDKYTVEKSLDGLSFTGAKDIKANNQAANNYSWTDAYPASGSDYYRIKSTSIDGKITYSAVMKIFIAKEISLLKVFPNPVINNTINLQLVNQPAGTYEIRLINSFGQAVLSKQILHPGGTAVETIRPQQIVPKGLYQLEINKPGGAQEIIKLMY